MTPQGNERPEWVVAKRLFPGNGTAPQANMAVEVLGGRVGAIVPAHELPAQAVRTAVHTLAPGFVDLQINGAGGVLFNDAPTPETLDRIARAARQGGTAHLLPTFITDEGERYSDALAAVDAAIDGGVPGIIGAHLEGPFLSTARPGIHPAHSIRKLTARDADLIGGFRHPLLLTVAPEAQDGGLLEQLTRAGVTLFGGHTDASAEQIAEATRLGLKGVTHLWNAMSGLHARAPGVVGAALTDARLFAGIIADGLHVAPANLRLAALAMGERLFLVTDAMPTVASDLRSFEIGGVEVTLRKGRLVSPEGTLGGAHLAMDEAVQNMVRFAGVSEATALDMASGRPARAIGLGETYGAIASGRPASLTCLDRDLNAVAVMVDGRWP